MTVMACHHLHGVTIPETLTMKSENLRSKAVLQHFANIQGTFDFIVCVKDLYEGKYNSTHLSGTFTIGQNSAPLSVIKTVHTTGVPGSILEKYTRVLWVSLSNKSRSREYKVSIKTLVQICILVFLVKQVIRRAN